MTTIATALIVACVITAWMSMKATGAKRFAAGLVLLPRLLLLLPKYLALAVLRIIAFPFRFFGGGVRALRRM